MNLREQFEREREYQELNVERVCFYLESCEEKTHGHQSTIRWWMDMAIKFESQNQALRNEIGKLKVECAEIQNARVRQMDLRAVAERELSALRKRIEDAPRRAYYREENGEFTEANDPVDMECICAIVEVEDE